MSFEDFIQRNYPEAFDKYLLQERLDNKPETLIGVEVISIRAGFSSMGGTHMIIDHIDDYQVHFSPTKKTDVISNNGTGWSCESKKFIDSVKLADPDLAAVQFYQPQNLN